MILLILLWSLFFAIHSLLAAEFVKEWFSQKMERGFRFYRLLYNFLSIAGFAAIWFWAKKQPQNRLLEENEAVLIVGSILMGLGIILGMLAFFQYRWKEFAGIDQLRQVPNQSNSHLVISGFNKHVRHPLYFAGILILVGDLMISPTTPTLIFVSITLIYLVIGTKLEEKKLVNEFGAEYRAYQKRVKMLIPYVF